MKLPVDNILPELTRQLACQTTLVLEAPPGAGKTTRVPPALLSAAWLKGQKILMLEPRRLATRNAAEFMARQMGEKVGQTVGYSIRYERQTSPKTRIEVMTEGILTRRLQTDPELTGVGLVIFDEFHERNIHSDIALALINDLRKGLREDLRILVMSATLDSDPLCKMLGASALRSEGRHWPVEIINLGGNIERNCVSPMHAAISRALAETDGDILAFLPGAYEIEHLSSRLSRDYPSLQISPLHSRLSAVKQQLALDKTERRKVILATNIAETSLTIEGISTVVDSGLCRQPGFDPGSGLTRLQTTKISQASAKQRAGRAGRQQAGTCYRLWGEAAHAALLPQTPAEIRSADLTPLTLDLSAWGLQDATQLDWLDPPPAGALAAARQLLQQLELTDQKDRLTADGKRANRLPVHPRFASLLLLAERLGELPVGCLLTACLSEPSGKAEGRSHDLMEELRLFAKGLHSDQEKHTPQIRAFRQLAQTFGTQTPEPKELNPGRIARLLAKAYPDRIACSRLTNGDYLLSSGRGAQTTSDSPLRNAPWLVIADISQNDRGGAVIRRALPLDADWLAQQSETTHWQHEVFWDETNQRVVARHIKRLGALELCAKTDRPTTEQIHQVLCNTIQTRGDALLNWDAETQQLLARIQLIHLSLGSPWPALDQHQLMHQPETWLAPYLSGISNGGQLKKLDLKPALLNLLDWSMQRQLEQLAPLRIAVPSGEKMKINYGPEGPSLPVKLQQLFGLAETPSLCQGRVPLKLQLLSPAGRPLAVTSDLRSFWDNVYPEVQKEMKGRYPKHPWPDDPWQAIPTRRTKKRSP